MHQWCLLIFARDAANFTVEGSMGLEGARWLVKCFPQVHTILLWLLFSGLAGCRCSLGYNTQYICQHCWHGRSLSRLDKEGFSAWLGWYFIVC